MQFSDLGLVEPLLKAIQEAGYSTPTPIQAQAIPAVLNGGDLLAGAQTGTGKTAGFTLPLLHKLVSSISTQPAGGKRVVRALILTPTRELAAQVEESVRVYGKYLPIRSMVMFGGVGMSPQIDALRRGVDVLVATPGRLLDHHQQGTLDLSHVEYFVLDEADRMLDMGFIHDIKRVLAVLPAKKQSLLFSATFSDEIKALADRLLKWLGAMPQRKPSRKKFTPLTATAKKNC
jgi:ATP-dependent RNA helicase RhlE